VRILLAIVLAVLLLRDEDDDPEDSSRPEGCDRNKDLSK
jgi:hypothetical protein